MKPRETGKTSAIVRLENVSRPWSRHLIMCHVGERDGSVSTYQNGIAAFEKYLRSTNEPEIRSLYFAMMAESADAQAVVEAYRHRILRTRMDGPTIVPLATNGFIARAPMGDIAFVPINEMRRKEVRNASMIVLDGRRLEQNGVPRFLWPSSTYIHDSKPTRWDIVHEEGMLARAGTMLVRFDSKNYRFTASSLTDDYGSFSLIDHFVDRIGILRDAQDYRRAWNAYLEDFMEVVLKTRSTLEKSLAHEDYIYAPSEDEGLQIVNRVNFIRSLRKLLGFAHAGDQAFQKLYPIRGGWAYDWVYPQVAKMNNAMGLPFVLSSFEDLSQSDIRGCIKEIMKLMDPVDHIEKVYMTRKIAKWVDVEFEGTPPKAFEGQRSPALRMLIDEIVYHAGALESDPGVVDKGEERKITFAFDGNRITVFDKSGGRALAPFVESDEKKSILQGYIKRMGPGADIDFIVEDFADGTRILRAIDITASREDGGNAGGGGHMVGPSESPAGAGNAGSTGFSGIARSESSESAPSRTLPGDMIENEICLDAATSDLAKGTDTVVKGAVLGLAVSTAMSAV
jgi:hypothetical protein